MKREELLFLPGMLCDAELWQAQADALADVAYCRILDLTGESIEGMADHVLSRAPARFALAGLSMGGYVALAVARKAPERVMRLCLANTSARPDTEEQTRNRRAMIARAEAGDFAEVLMKLMPLLTHRDRWADAALQGRLTSMIHRVGCANFVRQQRAIAARGDARPALPRMDCPVLIVAGAADRATPPDHAAEMAGAIPGARLHVIDDCAHLAPLEAPALVATLLRQWLAMPARAYAS